VFTSRTGARLINVYGPTEGTCICSSWDISPEDFDSDSRYAPLGRINPNFSYLIQNEQGEASRVGELALLGPQVASGYYNDPSRTSESFFIATSPPNVGKHGYRTGDIVREEDGILFFEGRLDNQIKHMGYRIELEEIESVISELSGVREVGCVYAPKPSGHGKIVAAVAAGPRPNMEDIMNHLRRNLPNYMIPASLLFFESLPKSPNGKVSRPLILQEILESDGTSD
jgi:D-alanine--poly(phosphoribitol) ligase subunit 1